MLWYFWHIKSQKRISTKIMWYKSANRGPLVFFSKLRQSWQKKSRAISNNVTKSWINKSKWEMKKWFLTSIVSKTEKNKKLKNCGNRKCVYGQKCWVKKAVCCISLCFLNNATFFSFFAKIRSTVYTKMAMDLDP